MKILLAPLLIIALSTSMLYAADIDLSDVKLSSKSQAAISKFEAALEKEEQIYLKKVNALRAKCLKTMTSDSKKQKDALVALKIKEKIVEIEKLAPTDIFGNKIVKFKPTLLTIISATYGSGDRQADIAKTLTKMIKDDTINIIMDHEVLGIADPAPHTGKVANIVYKSLGKTYTVQIGEKQSFVIP